MEKGQTQLYQEQKPFVITETTPFLSKGELIFPFSSYKIALRTNEQTIVFDQSTRQVFVCDRKNDPNELSLKEVNNEKMITFFKEYIMTQRAKRKINILFLEKKRKSSK